MKSTLKRLLPLQVRQRIGRALRNRRRVSEPAIGQDFLGDVKSRLPDFDPRVIFDIGAYIGITAIEFSDQFPKAMIYAFEPSPENIKRLRENIPSYNAEIMVQQCAMGGKSEGQFKSFLSDPAHPSMSRIVDIGGSNTIAMDTVDRFCGRTNVDHVHIMKIDTEGHELEVLDGASDMLGRADIDIVKAECTFLPGETYHTKFRDICDVVYPLGYRVFGIYEQTDNLLFNHTPEIRRADVAFISPTFRRTAKGSYS